MTRHSTAIGNGVAAAVIIAGGGPEDPVGDAAGMAAREGVIDALSGEAGSAEAGAAEASAPPGPSTSYDPTGGLKGVSTNSSPDAFIGNLEASGYTSRTINGPNGPTTILTNGESTYTVYTRTSTGQAGTSYQGPNGQTVKFNLGSHNVYANLSCD